MGGFCLAAHVNNLKILATTHEAKTFTFPLQLEISIDKNKFRLYNLFMNERNWGGKRKGAGRKKGNTVYKTISISLPECELEILQEAAERQNMTVSRFISKYLGLDTAAQIKKEVQSEKPSLTENS